METVLCYSCSYPIATQIGERVHCPSCASEGNVEEKVKEVNMLGIKSPQIAQGVTIPTWLAVGIVTFGFGIVLGPAVISLTETGSKTLADYATKRITHR